MISESKHDVEQLECLMREYYIDYYRDQLGLPDWEKRADGRNAESENMQGRIEDLEQWLGLPIGEGMKVLVVGGGTGAEYFALASRGCDVYAVEPNEKAVRIARLKAEQLQISPERFQVGVGENLTYKNEKFDLVWCLNVLEHVQDVDACVSEMVRVTKQGARMFIAAPDYRHPYEAHYKLNLFIWLPKCVLQLWLRLIGRPAGFLKSLNFINSMMLANSFRKHQVMAFLGFYPWPSSAGSKKKVTARIANWLSMRWLIQHNQYWIVVKLKKAV